MPIDFISYSMNIDYIINWFPRRNDAAIDTQRTRSGHFSYNSSNMINTFQHLIGEGSDVNGAHSDSFLPLNQVFGQIGVSLNENKTFFVTIFVNIGKEGAAQNREKSYSVGPKADIPFMINVDGKGDPEIFGTSVSVHGTITTGKQYFENHIENPPLVLDP